MTRNQPDDVFVAVIGDIRGSRDLTDRSEAQQEFKQVVNSLNHENLSLRRVGSRANRRDSAADSYLLRHLHWELQANSERSVQQGY
jgi:hypothetical protein